MSSTVFGLGGLDDEARDQSTTARGEITGPACGTGQETKREGSGSADAHLVIV